VIRALAFVCLFAAACASGCQDPCVALAERICNCEPTPSDRRSCRADRIVNRQSQVQITQDDRSFCEAQLETCDCTDIDENRLEQCGFVVEAE
jgi:hypothetical protein